MEKNPPQNDHLLLLEDPDIEHTDLSLRIIDTTHLISQQRSQSTFDHDAYIDTKETNVHQFFALDQSTAGGPPGVLSIFEAVVSLGVSGYSRFRQTNGKN